MLNTDPSSDPLRHNKTELLHILIVVYLTIAQHVTELQFIQSERGDEAYQDFWIQIMYKGYNKTTLGRELIPV